jgi:hypothetical protein
VSFEEDIIISPANEYEVLQLLLAECRDRFSAYGGQCTVLLPHRAAVFDTVAAGIPRACSVCGKRDEDAGMRSNVLADAHITCTLADNMEADMKMLQQPDLTPAERTAAQAREQLGRLIKCSHRTCTNGR